MILLLFAISGCGGNTACIDADDFGFTTVEISSRYDENELVGAEADQVAPWKDHDLVLSGKALVVMIRNWHYGEDPNSKLALSAWCPWWGTEEYPNTLAPVCKRLRECVYVNNEPCYSIPPHTIYATDATENPAITNAPCLMKKGVGLYAYLQQRGGASPNQTLDSRRNPPSPPGVKLHAGEPTVVPGPPDRPFSFYDFSGNGTMRQAGGMYYNYDGQHDLTSSRLNYVGGKLYFKILDSHYTDNSGQYIAVVKSGLHEPGGDLFKIIRKLVRERLFGTGDPGAPSLEQNGVVRTIFQNIINTPGYIHAVRAALILYISVTGIMFVMGSIQLTHGEVLNRMLKVIVITALLTPRISWDFFNDYIFIWMYHGADFLIEILYDAANTGPGDSSIITFLTTPQIMAKLASLLFSTWTGWLYIIMYFKMLVFLTVVFFNATVLFLTAQVMIGLLVSLAPIFIAFYLFESTKSFFENWVKQMIGYAIQTVIVSAGILFLSMIIRNQVYNTLGFRVCLHEFPDMNTATGGLGNLIQGADIDQGDGPVVSIFAWWFPHILSPGDNPRLQNILIPKAHFYQSTAALGSAIGVNGPNAQTINAAAGPQPGDFCPAYECIGQRYPDLPFLDPNNAFEARQMALLRSDRVVDYGGLFVIVVCVYLLHHFNNTTVSIAKFLSGTTGNLTNTESIVSNMGLNPAAIALYPIAKPMKMAYARASKRVESLWKDKVLKNVKKAAANRHADRLRKQAMKDIGMMGSKYDVGKGNFGASKDLVGKVESKYGLKHSDAKKFKTNRGGYASDLQKALGDKNDKKAYKIVEGLGNGKASDFDKLLAKHHFGKKLSELSAGEQEEMKRLKKDPEIQKMLKDKRRADLFQDAYIDAYIESANKGSGALSERQKRQHQIDSRRQKNMAMADELKRYLSGGLFGGEYDEISNKDPHKRTQNEIIADNDRIVDGKIAREQLDELTVKHGMDIQRPDFLSEQRADGANMSYYDNLIEENIRNDVHQSLNDSPFMYGDTYVRENMSDEDFGKMILGLQHAGNEYLTNDGYLKQKEIYEGDEAALAELDHREEMIKSAVQEEIERLKEVKYGDKPEKSDLFSDVKASEEKKFGKAKDSFNKSKQGWKDLFGKKDK